MKRHYQTIVVVLLLIIFAVSLTPAGTAEAATKKLNKKTLSLWEGQEFQLIVKHNKLKFTWASDNEDVAEVDEYGWVSAVSEGSATISATRKNTSFTCTVTVKKPTITINKDTIRCKFESVKSLAAGEEAMLKLVGTEFKSFKASDPYALNFRIDDYNSKKAYVTANYAFDEPVTIYATCTNGYTYTCELQSAYMPTVGQEITQLNTPGENQWGLVFLHEQKYEYVPEMRVTLEAGWKVEDVKQIFRDAVCHGTNDIYITCAGDGEVPFGMHYVELWSPIICDIDCLFARDDVFTYGRYDDKVGFLGLEEINENTIKVSMVYKTEQKILNYLRIKNYPELDAKEQQVYEAALKVINNALSEEGVTHYSALLSVHDQINERVSYCLLSKREFPDNLLCHDPTVTKLEKDSRGLYKKSTGDCLDAVGAFIGNQVICQGYSGAYDLCLSIMGYDSCTTYGPGHMWNLVTFDGVDYNIDLTDDDSMASRGLDPHYDFLLTDAEEGSATYCRDKRDTNIFRPSWY